MAKVKSIDQTTYAENHKKVDFEKIFLAHQKLIHQYCYRSTHSTEIAEELTQDIFVCLYQAWDRIDHQRDVKFYLQGIAKNAVLGWFRKLRYDNKLKDELIYRYAQHQSADIEELQIQSKLDLAYIKEIISQLPTNGKKTFELIRFEDQSYEEVAKQLSLSKNTVKYHLKKADQLVRNNLGIVENVTAIIIYLFLYR